MVTPTKHPQGAKPTSSDIEKLIAAVLDRADRVGVRMSNEARASMIMRELRAHEVKLVWHKFNEGEEM
jgi:hypothetical protein